MFPKMEFCLTSITMAELDTLTQTDFAPHLDHAFTIAVQSAVIATVLTQVRTLGAPAPGQTREPFALLFHNPQNLRLPQGIYPVSHPTLGILEIFLVQVAGGPGGSDFEAIFN